MPMDEYTVSASPTVTAQLKHALDTARTLGVFPLASRAARWISEELARTPLEFGESRGYLPHLHLHIRLGFARPLSVRFAVHEPSKQVFVTAFALSG